MVALRTAFLAALALVLMGGGLALGGPRARAPMTEELQASVRSNPASYKPAFSSYTGFVAVRVASGASTSRRTGGRTYGGGYTYGK